MFEFSTTVSLRSIWSHHSGNEARQLSLEWVEKNELSIYYITSLLKRTREELDCAISVERMKEFDAFADKYMRLAAFQ